MAEATFEAQADARGLVKPAINKSARFAVVQERDLPVEDILIGKWKGWDDWGQYGKGWSWSGKGKDQGWGDWGSSWDGWGGKWKGWDGWGGKDNGKGWSGDWGWRMLS